MSAETRLADWIDSSPVFAGPLLAGEFIAVAVGVFGRVHDPSNTKLKLFFSDTLAKLWLTSSFWFSRNIGIET